MARALEAVLAEHRPKGALWGWMVLQGVGHEFAGQEVLALPILDAAVRLRYPANEDVRKGPVKLKPVAAETGWVADIEAIAMAFGPVPIGVAMPPKSAPSATPMRRMRRSR